MTSDEIRKQFIDFFVQRHGHTFVPSSPVVPLDDPTLLFTNAGMNQFKPIFLGQEKRPYTRAANTQKCIRAGGKHNDLDDVGRSRRHHTFFEMLGNWSFGDYFKRGAIEFAWELLTQVWKLDPTRLHVSCYEGNPAANIPRDDEAANLWKEIAKLPDDHIHYFGKDNFWEMGDTGPCGPCTEIYYDRTPEKTGGKSVNGDDPRVMEIWNLVFIQYNRDASGKLTPLPAQHVDTGMGFERICQVLQGKEDNYGTDLWKPLFGKIAELSGKKYTGQFPKTNAADPVAEAANEQLRHDIAFRVVADHVRCLTFALTDGATPSNEGRGYVLRRILRRAVRFGRQQLGLNEPFMHELVPVVVESMAGAFPELKRDPGRVVELVKDEEISFSKTLDRGLALFEIIAEKVAAIASGAAYTTDDDDPLDLGEFDGTFVHQTDKKLFDEAGKNVFPGAAAFKLHDTYGFPIDLTRIMAEERGLTVDIPQYEMLMQRARIRSQVDKKAGASGVVDLDAGSLGHLEAIKIPKTKDDSKFLGEPIETEILDISTQHGFAKQFIKDQMSGTDEVSLILRETNFYAEMGGQVGDKGVIIGKDFEFEVRTTRVSGGYVLHAGKLIRGSEIKVGDKVKVQVSVDRPLIEKNHTATHIANWALREVLGEGVQQKGSLVDAEKLRFDFSQPKALTDEEISRVEELVREKIAAKLPVFAKEKPQQEAMKINGLRAVFGEKYPPMVRVVSIGADVEDLIKDPANPNWRKYSIEFCGGTHVANSGEIENFAITAEESVSKGIRRLVALTGDAAGNLAAVGKEVEDLIAKSGKTADQDLQPIIASLQKLSSSPISLRAKRRAQAQIVALQARYRAYEKQAAKSESPGAGKLDAGAAAEKLLAGATDLAGGKLIIGQIAGANGDQLRGAIDSLRKKVTSFAIMLACAEGESATFVAAVSDDLVAKGLKAGDWVKKTASVAGGGGGGRPQMAQGSGRDASKIDEALKVAHELAVGIISP